MATDLTSYACVGATALLGAGVLALQLRTLKDVCARNDTWPLIEAVCKSRAQYLKALCQARAEVMQSFLQAGEHVQFRGVVCVVFDEQLHVVSDGLRAVADEPGHDERLRALVQLLQPNAKHDVQRRAHVSIARADGSVRQHEVCVRWVSCTHNWVVALKWQ